MDHPSAYRRRLGLILWVGSAAVVSAVYLTGLGGPLTNYDEPIFAEFIRHMHATGDYVSLVYQGAQTHQRPPLSVAVYALLATLVSGEVGLRLGPALFSLATIWFVGLFIAWRFRDWAAAIVATLVCAAAPTYFLYGRLLLSDPPFVASVLLASCAVIAAQRDSRFLIAAGGFFGLAFALKSFAAAVPLAALSPWIVVAIWRSTARWRVGGLATTLFLLLAAPFFVVGLVRHGDLFWREHVGRMLLDRAQGELSPLVGLDGPFAYATQIVRGDGIVYAAIVFAALAMSSVVALRRRDRELGASVTAAAATWGILSLLQTRLPHYLLVFYPLLALTVGILATTLWRSCSGGQRWRVVGTAVIVSVILFACGLAPPPRTPETAPSTASSELGTKARALLPENQPIYSVNWYAPALSYYAARPWHMLSSDAKMTDLFLALDPFAQAENVATVPPWPVGLSHVVVPDAFVALVQRQLPAAVVARSQGIQLLAVGQVGDRRR